MGELRVEVPGPRLPHRAGQHRHHAYMARLAGLHRAGEDRAPVREELRPLVRDMPGEETRHHRIGRRVARLGTFGQPVGDEGRQNGHSARSEPRPLVRSGANDDDAVRAPDVAPALREGAQRVTELAALRHGEDGVSAPRIGTRSRLLERRRIEGDSQVIGQPIGRVHVEHDAARSPNVQSDVVRCAGPPGRDDVTVTRALVLPPVADDAARVLRPI